MAQQRVQPGVPSGGEFSASSHDEAVTTLSDPDVVEMDGLYDDQVDEVCGGYLAAATWSSKVSPTPDGEPIPVDADGKKEEPEPVDADEYEISDDATKALRVEAAKAWNTMPADLRQTLIDNNVDLSQWGHDMWLTREGHGTGFWDRSDTMYVNPETRAQLAEHASQAREGGNFWLDGNNELQYERM